MTGSYPDEYDLKCELDSCRRYPIVTDTERGEMLCGGCGLVLAQKMEDAHGSIHPYGMDDRSGTGVGTGPAGTSTMHDRGLSTVIGGNIDSTGHHISNKSRRAFGRLRIWDKRSKSGSVLGGALTRLSAMRTKLSVPDPVAEDAARLYRRAVSAKLTRGRTTTSLVAASLYLACRRSNTPRTLDDVAMAGNLERKVLSRDTRTLIRKLELSPNQYDIGSFVTKIANNLGLKEKTKRDALRIMDLVGPKTATGKNPVAQAAAALYLACMTGEENVSQRGLAAEAGVSDVTIRNHVLLFRKYLEK